MAVASNHLIRNFNHLRSFHVYLPQKLSKTSRSNGAEVTHTPGFGVLGSASPNTTKHVARLGILKLGSKYGTREFFNLIHATFDFPSHHALERHRKALIILLLCILHVICRLFHLFVRLALTKLTSPSKKQMNICWYWNGLV